MINLYQILAEAQGGGAMTSLARQFQLTEQQTQAAVDALLPAFSLGLRQMSATPGGFANLFGMMAQPNFQAMFTGAPASAQGRNTGNDLLGMMFGSPEMSRAVAEQAAQYAGIGSAIMKRMLPVVAAMIIGGMMRTMNMSGMGDVADAARTSDQASRGGGGDMFSQLMDAGREVQQAHLDNMQRVFDAFFKSDKRG
jgi:hypothetical protein